jgi:formylglycine-generating enzyme required for sulfatase activity
MKRHEYYLPTLLVFVLMQTVAFSWVSAQQLPSFVKVVGGTFIMGDAYGDLDEKPNQVTVSTFYISPKEISVGQFRAYCEATGERLPGEYVDSPHDNEPIRHLNIHRARKYCE